MQQAFAFASDDLSAWKDALTTQFGAPALTPRRSPLGQLVKSLISTRTRDPVSRAAYDALVRRYPLGPALASASPTAIEAIIAPVTYAADKAVNLAATLATIARERPDLDLAFLAGRPLADALAWLERLPGVGREVAAATLNGSTLNQPVLIVDSLVLRVLQRLGFVRPTADGRAASEAATAAMPGWSGDDFLTFQLLAKRLGQTICRWDEPACDRCPLAADCPTGRRRAPDAAARERSVPRRA